MIANLQPNKRKAEEKQSPVGGLYHDEYDGGGFEPRIG